MPEPYSLFVNGEDNRIRRVFIAYFDILGFKELINSTENLEPIISDFKRIIQGHTNIQQEFGQEYQGFNFYEGPEYLDERIRGVTYSDTILFLSTNDTLADFLLLVLVSRNFFIHTLKNGFPLRGAIHVGDIHYEEDVYMGPALVTAYEWAEDQDWAGIIITPECDRYVEYYYQAIAEATILTLGIDSYVPPLKKKRYQEYSTINWPYYFSKDESEISKEDIRNLFIKRHINYGGSYDVEKKIENTYTYYNKRFSTQS